MPQATDELRAVWSDDTALTHLASEGFRLTRRWTWKHADPNYQVTHKDRSAVMYMIQEWDYAGLED